VPRAGCCWPAARAPGQTLARHNVKAITERFSMSKANDAVAKVKKNQVRYRAVLAN